MRATLGSRARHGIAGLIALLIVATMIGGMVGCDPSPAPAVQYSLTVSSTAGGSVTTPGEGTRTYDAGTVVNLVATPESGYLFVNWTGSVGAVSSVNSAATTVTMNANCSITANFEAIPPGQFGLTVSSTEGGSVTVPGEGTFAYQDGTIVDLVAVADECYEFAGWTGDAVDDPDSSTTSITMDGARSVTASFILVSYSLTVGSTEGGSVTTPGEGVFSYGCGTVVDLVATPEAGYRFMNWTGDTGAVADVDSYTTTITMNDDCSISASFIKTYDLTTGSSSGGSVTNPGEGTFTYDTGTVVDLVATPEVGYRFVNWTGDTGAVADVDSATTIITMTGDYSITANFVATYALTISSTSYGTVTMPGEGVFIYDAGTVVDLVAMTEAGYRFINWTGDVGTAANVNSATTTITMSDDYEVIANFGEYTPVVATGLYHTVGLKSDGTVVAIGRNNEGQCNVSGWSDIIQVAAGGYHTVGLKTDGTVVAIGRNNEGQCGVSAWTDIIQVAAGGYHTIGLKSDGTAIAVGANGAQQCNVGSWTGIVQVAAGEAHTVGLRSDQKVMAVGSNYYGQCNVGGWSGITHVAAGHGHTVGVTMGSTAVAAGWNGYWQCNVDGWSNIVRVSAGYAHTVGLRPNGTVVAAGDNGYGQCNVGGWSAIIQVAAGGWHTVGLRPDGSLIATGLNNYGQCNVGGWMLKIPVYNLTIGSTAGGEVTVPSEGTFAYRAGAVVELVAEPDAGYRFGSWTGHVGTVADVNSSITTITVNGHYSITANFEPTFMVSAGFGHTVGLKSDGTLVAAGWNGYGQCNVGELTDIVQVSAGYAHTVGLKSDGTVVAVGWNGYGQCDVSGWTGIVEVSAGEYHTVGLKSDGTVVAAGRNNFGQCEVGDWTHIIQVSAGYCHTVGLKTDGTVVAAGRNDQEQCDVGGWAGIVQVAADMVNTVGLKSDGTVVAVGQNDYGQCNVDGWTDIVHVAAGGWHTVGLKSDGTVVAVGRNQYKQCMVGGGAWTDMLQVAAGYGHTVGLRSDGTVAAVGAGSGLGFPHYGQCDVGDWNLIV